LFDTELSQSAERRKRIVAQNGAKSKTNVVKIDQTELWRMGSNCSGFIASLVSIAIACARAAAFAKNDLWEHYHMIRQRKRPNAKEAKTLKVLSEFKRSGLSSWKTSGNHFIQALDDAMAIVENEMSRCAVIQHASRK
jgi:hypothetical protein